MSFTPGQSKKSLSSMKGDETLFHTDDCRDWQPNCQSDNVDLQGDSKVPVVAGLASAECVDRVHYGQVECIAHHSADARPATTGPCSDLLINQG